MDDERFDGMFYNVCGQTDGIGGLFDSFFGFLRRKTDFFSDTNAADKICTTTYERNKAKYIEAKQIDAQKNAEAQMRKQAEEQRKALDEKAKAAETPKVMEVTEDEAMEIEKPAPAVSEAPAETEEGKEEEKEEKKEDGPPPEGNGGTTDKYVWTQTLGEVVLNIPITKDTTGRLCKVNCTSKHLKVDIKGETIIDGDFPARVKSDELIWTLETSEGQKYLIITIDKIENMSWWKSAIEGDPEIDTQKIRPEDSKLGDLDGETRSTVEKMMVDQSRKAQGLPTTEEQEKQDMMKKFMDQHPEMDFSKCKFN